MDDDNSDIDAQYVASEDGDTTEGDSDIYESDSERLLTNVEVYLITKADYFSIVLKYS